ncbi:SMP-30/gluconolactonase/LRE family protein [Streptomyces sp. NPDC048473]|uniref:SMP-30/gluconolactonase/LRE family protein n=1 Tax=unclassified Streptomyces TaxID=2593676 RepID=UPI00371747E3
MHHDHSPAGIWAQGDYELGEGARWVDGRLVFVDILTGRLFEAPGSAPSSGPARELLRLDVPLGAVAPVQGRPGHWIAAAGTGIALLDPDGRTEWLARPEDHTRVHTRMNDGVWPVLRRRLRGRGDGDPQECTASSSDERPL